MSDKYAAERMTEIWAEELGGHQILTNNSKWINFTTVRNERWYDGNVVLLGDAAHTAHFSIGSGTKLAMEDALALAACLHENPSVGAALEAYQAERKPVVESTQRAAQASLEWFENIGMYADQDPAQERRRDIAETAEGDRHVGEERKDGPHIREHVEEVREQGEQEP